MTKLFKSMLLATAILSTSVVQSYAMDSTTQSNWGVVSTATAQLTPVSYGYVESVTSLQQSTQKVLFPFGTNPLIGQIEKYKTLVEPFPIQAIPEHGFVNKDNHDWKNINHTTFDRVADVRLETLDNPALRTFLKAYTMSNTRDSRLETLD